MQSNLQMPKQKTRVNASQWGVFVVFILVIPCILLPKSRFIYINHTNSLPLGLYLLSNEKIELGKYVIFSKPDNLINIQRDWILGNASFLKQISAIPGDTVCIQKNTVLINGKETGIVKAVDRNGVELPKTLENNFCRKLKMGEFWTATNHPNSFDSRYYGPIKIDQLKTVKPLITFKES